MRATMAAIVLLMLTACATAPAGTSPVRPSNPLLRISTHASGKHRARSSNAIQTSRRSVTAKIGNLQCVHGSARLAQTIGSPPCHKGASRAAVILSE